MGPSFPYPPDVDDIVSTFANPRYFVSDANYPVELDCISQGVPALWYATPEDIMDYGKDIYSRVVEEEWGPITPYIVPPEPVFTKQQLLDYANMVLNTYRSLARSYTLDETTTIKSDTIDSTTAEINSLVLAGMSNPDAQTNWVDNYGIATLITGTQAIELGNQTVQYKSNLYAVLSEGTNGINNGTITTPGQIDNLPWPT